MNENAADEQQQCLTPYKNIAIIPALLDFEEKERKIARKVVWLQIMVALVSATIAYSTKNSPQIALAVLSGGSVSAVNGTLLVWRMSRSASFSSCDSQHIHGVHHQLRLLYFYAAERFLVVITLLGFFMAALKLSPLALLAGFIAGQSVMLVARLLFSKIKTEIVNKNV